MWQTAQEIRREHPEIDQKTFCRRFVQIWIGEGKEARTYQPDATGSARLLFKKALSILQGDRNDLIPAFRIARQLAEIVYENPEANFADAIIKVFKLIDKRGHAVPEHAEKLKDMFYLIGFSTAVTYPHTVVVESPKDVDKSLNYRVHIAYTSENQLTATKQILRELPKLIRDTVEFARVPGITFEGVSHLITDKTLVAMKRVLEEDLHVSPSSIVADTHIDAQKLNDERDEFKPTSHFGISPKYLLNVAQDNLKYSQDAQRNFYLTGKLPELGLIRFTVMRENLTKRAEMPRYHATIA